jgi:hypothetical protein
MPDTLIKQYIRGSSKYHRSSGGGGGGHLTQCTSNTNLPAVVVSTTARRRGTCVRWIWVVSLSCVHPIKLHVHFPFGGRAVSTPPSGVILTVCVRIRFLSFTTSIDISNSVSVCLSSATRKITNFGQHFRPVSIVASTRPAFTRPSIM